MDIDLSQPHFLRIADVAMITGLSRATIYAAMAEKRFPQSVKLTQKAVAWRRTDIEAWIENLTETQAA